MVIKRKPFTIVTTSALISLALACTPRDQKRNETGSTSGTSGSTTETAPPPANEATEPTRPGTPGTTGGATSPSAPSDAESMGDKNTGTTDTQTGTTGTSGTDTEVVEESVTETETQTPEPPSDVGTESPRPTGPGEAGPGTPSTAETETTPPADKSATEAQKPISLSSLNSDDVKQLQTALNQHGAKIRVDGIVGPETRTALSDFQAKNNISGEGELTPETISQLGISSETIYAH